MNPANVLAEMKLASTVRRSLETAMKFRTPVSAESVLTSVPSVSVIVGARRPTKPAKPPPVALDSISEAATSIESNALSATKPASPSEAELEVSVLLLIAMVLP